MILGLGTDLLDTGRVERELSRGGWRLDDGIFTPAEIRHCRAGRPPAGRYAVCFAAKEATLKALGIRVRSLAIFREVEVLPEPETDRQYRIVLHDHLRTESERLGVERIHLAIARRCHQTAATVILEA